MKNYTNSTPKLGKLFYENFLNKGKVVLLNLLKFKEIDDYTGLDKLKPAKEISGRDAYQLYIEGAIPELEKAKSKIILLGNCKEFLIGPESEVWDAMLLIEHQSVKSIMKFNENKDYLKILSHRTAALEDSRLLPIKESNGFN